MSYSVGLGTLTASTSNGNSGDLRNEGGRGVHVVVDITAITAGSLTVTVEGKDSPSGKYYTLLASAALGSTGTTVLKVFPAATASANVAANDMVPHFWRVKWVVATGPVTATIGASLV